MTFEEKLQNIYLRLILERVQKMQRADDSKYFEEIRQLLLTTSEKEVVEYIQSKSQLSPAEAHSKKVVNVLGRDKDSKGKSGALVVLLVLMSVLGGVLTTALIIRATARSHAEAVVERYQLRKREGLAEAH